LFDRLSRLAESSIEDRLDRVAQRLSGMERFLGLDNQVGKGAPVSTANRIWPYKDFVFLS
jgi:hypothetical protein